MKQITDYIIEKFKINSKTVCAQNGKINYNSFKHEIQELFDMNDDDFDHMIRCFSTDIDIDKFPKINFELIDNEHGLYDTLGNICADLINHPSKYKKLSAIDILYSSVTSASLAIDLRVFKYTLYNRDSNQDKYFLFFLDYTDDKFYIYEYEGNK